MTRLIDADKLEAHEQLISFGNGMYETTFIFYKDDIDEQPTVDAVPIKWIENYLKNYRYMAPIEKTFVRKMIKAWAERKEE